MTRPGGDHRAALEHGSPHHARLSRGVVFGAPVNRGGVIPHHQVTRALHMFVDKSRLGAVVHDAFKQAAALMF